MEKKKMVKKDKFIGPEDIKIEVKRGLDLEDQDILTPEYAVQILAELTDPIKNEDEREEQLAAFKYLLALIDDARKNNKALTINEANVALYAYRAGWAMSRGADISDVSESYEEDFINLLKEIRQPRTSAVS